GRADYHLETLKRTGEEWWRPHEDLVLIRIEEEDAPRSYVVYADPMPIPPISLSLICGDLVTNLRAALDHAITDLVIDEDGTPGRHHSFPIAYSEKEWRRKVVSPASRKSPLDGLDPGGDRWSIIYWAQPFHWRELQMLAPIAHPLAILSRLVNRDKHA